MMQSLQTLMQRWGLITGLLLSVSAQAASFDCAKAKSNVEKMICADAELSKLDEELAATYKAASQNKAQEKAIQQKQSLWLKERNSCLDEVCIKRSYQTRATALFADIDNTSTSNNKRCPFGKVFVGKYVSAVDTGYPENTLLLTRTANSRIFNVELISFWSCKRNDDGSCTNIGQSKGEVSFENCSGKLIDPAAPDCNTFLQITSGKSIFVTQNGICFNGYNATPVGEYFAQ